jgi:hypothetical protein
MDNHKGLNDTKDSFGSILTEAVFAIMIVRLYV